MANRGRTSKKREKLPPLIEAYLRVLEGRTPAEMLQELLTASARWREVNQHLLLDGVDAICAEIKRWLSSVKSTQIEMIRMTDQGDCAKVDFVVHTTLRKPLPIPVELPVIGMYMIEDGKISEPRALGTDPARNGGSWGAAVLVAGWCCEKPPFVSGSWQEHNNRPAAPR